MKQGEPDRPASFEIDDSRNVVLERNRSSGASVFARVRGVDGFRATDNEHRRLPSKLSIVLGVCTVIGLVLAVAELFF